MGEPMLSRIFGVSVLAALLLSHAAWATDSSSEHQIREAEDRAIAAEARALAAEKRAVRAEARLRALRARASGSGELTSAEQEASRRLDQIILEQHLRDAGK